MTSLFAALTGVEDRARPFLLTPDRGSWSYGGVFDLAGRMAAVLREYGARPGSRVMVQVDKSPEAVALYLAALWAGATYVPLNPSYTAVEVEFFAGDAEPAVFVADPARAAELAGVLPATTTLLTLDATGAGMLADHAAGSSADTSPSPCHGDQVAAMLYTSGTTGRSKGAMLTSDNLLANAEALFTAWGWRPDDVLLHVLPIFHTHGLFVALGLAMLGGSAVRFHHRFDVAAVLADLPRSTVMMGVPTHYHRLLADRRLDDVDLGGMRLFTSGSAPLPTAVHAEFERRTGYRILERYGMTETGMLTSNPLEGDRIAGTVGFPLPGVEVRVMDDGRSCAASETGAVEVRGSNVFSGYWRLPDKTAEEFTDDGFFRTGDLGRLDADGRLTLAGRAGDLIISGGLNVYPQEVEQVLDGHPGVGESAVIGVPHADFGEAVVAVVVADGALDVDALADAARTALADFKRPKHYEVVDALPRNAMGKVQKAELRRRLAGIFTGR